MGVRGYQDTEKTGGEDEMSIDLITYIPTEEEGKHNCPLCQHSMEISSPSAAWWGDFYDYTCRECGIEYNEMTRTWKNSDE